MNLTYDLSKRGSDSLYEYLYKCIRNDIRSGKLPAGSRLPSKRALAADNGVALITVENAYAQLVVEGYAETKQRSGFYVTDIGLDPGSSDIPEPADHDMGEENRNDPGQPADCGSVTACSPGHDFTVSNIISDSFPYSTWTRIIRRVISDRERDFALAPPSEGIRELREAIADYIRGSKGVEVNPDNVIIGPGTEYLHSLILQLVGRNRFVAVEDPGYSKPGLIYESNGMKVLYIPMDDEGISIDALLDSNVRLVHTSPSHQFPTGVVMSASRRHRLVNWAKDQGAYIIEDDYDSEFRFKGRPLPPLMSLDRDHVIYMNTFSGTLAASIRIAYMILPDGLMGIYRNRLAFLSGTVSAFEQLTLAEFIRGGYYERHISRMKNVCRRIRSRYEKALDRSLLSGYAWFQNDDAGLQMNLILTDVSAGKNSHEPDDAQDPDCSRISIRDRLQSRGIRIQTVADHCHRRSSRYSNRLIFRLADMEEDELVKVYDEIYHCLYEI